MDEHSETRPAPPSPPDVPGPDPPAAAPGTAPLAKRRTRAGRRSLFGGLTGYVRQLGRDVVSVTLGKLVEPAAEPEPSDEAPSTTTTEQQALSDSGYKRVRVLHDMAEKLRGAADTYIAVKLDEIEARVDAKLDRVEERIDHKIVELHEQLRQMRDRELRHRLRLLKITLVFTVLVALLSLGYKWLKGVWFA
jgi:hypothetical protein